MFLGRKKTSLNIRKKKKKGKYFGPAIPGTAEDSNSNIAFHYRCRPRSLYFPATDSIRFPYEGSASNCPKARITYEVTKQMRTASMVFFALAIAFIGIGISGQRTFLYIGIAFLVIAVLRLMRSNTRH